MKYRFTDTEIKKLLKNLVIVVDTREQVNKHILDYLDKKKKKYKIQKLDQGDYAAYIESNEETKKIGVNKDWYFSDEIVVERKASLDEVANNFTKDRERIEAEFLRLNKYNTSVVFLIEDPNGFQKMKDGDYRSQYKPASFEATLETFIARYGIDVRWRSKADSGREILKIFHYNIREILKNKGYIEEPA